MLLSQKLLLRILGALWLIDGLLQLQPRMFTMDMVNGVMLPMLQNQPELIAVNLLIATVQVLMGLSLLMLAGRWVKGVLLVSVAWAIMVRYGGEGMSMLLTGHASILTGAPGAVLFYPLLGLVVYPHQRFAASSQNVAAKVGKTSENSVISRLQLRWILSGFWLFAGLLQLQPYWWQPEQISQTIGTMVSQGGLNVVLVDPALQRLSTMTTNIEIPLNIVLVLICLGLVLSWPWSRTNNCALFSSRRLSPVSYSGTLLKLSGVFSVVWQPISIRAYCS